MPTDEAPRKGTVSVKKGSIGPARRAQAGARAATAIQKPSKQQLDARQEQIGPARRRGPDLPQGDVTRSRALTAPADAPETECDDTEAEDR